MGVMQTDIEIEVKNIDIMISKSDKDGNLIYANPIFYKFSGYKREEFIGFSLSKMRHPDMSKIMFLYLWNKLKSGREVKMFIKNLTNDERFYWAYTSIRAELNPDGSFRNYISIQKMMNPKAKKIIEPLYKQLLKIEEKEGMSQAVKTLDKFSKNNGVVFSTFDHAMEKIQNS